LEERTTQKTIDETRGMTLDQLKTKFLGVYGTGPSADNKPSYEQM